MRVVEALAVGTDKPDPVAAGGLDQFFLEFFPVRPGFGKTAGNDDGGLDPGLAALFNGPGHGPGRNDHHGQIRRAGNVADLFKGRQFQNLVGLGINGIDGPGETGVDQVIENIMA